MNKFVVAAVAALTLTAATPALANGDGAGSNRYDYLNGFRVLTPQELNSGQLFEGRNARVEGEQRGTRVHSNSRGSVTIENILDPTTTARGEYIRGGGGR